MGRQKRLKIRVTFPNGKVICYSIVEKTLIETLKEIGSSSFHRISLEVGHLPLITHGKHSKYGEWMKPIVDGWYVNTQSDTNQKYMQLVAIKNQLKLDLKVEIGCDFESKSIKMGNTQNKEKAYLRVYLPNLPAVTTEPYLVYFYVLKKIGFEKIKNKIPSIQEQKLITSTKQYDKQVQAGDFLWVTLPPKESLVIKWLSIISSVMKFEMMLKDIKSNKIFKFPIQSPTIIKIKKTPFLQRKAFSSKVNSFKINTKEEKNEVIEKYSPKVDVLIDDEKLFHVNDKVKHKIWGEGVIKEIILGGSLIGVNFSSMNKTYVKPNSLSLLDEKEKPKHHTVIEEHVITPNHKYSIKQLEDNAKRLRRMIRLGGIGLGDSIISPDYGIGIVTHADNFIIKASFNNITRTLLIGNDFIEKRL